jgi:DNA-binding Lrp family transcriptional regulator
MAGLLPHWCEGHPRTGRRRPPHHERLQRSPILSIPGAAASIGISAPTVAKSMQHMRQLGILREITGRQRHRLFVYEAYLAILNEGTEPIR